MLGHPLLAKLEAEKLARSNQMLFKLAHLVLRHIPDASALIFYGSQVRGDATRASDLDLLVITLEAPGFRQRARIEQAADNELGLSLHLSVTSPRAVESYLRTEPYLRHWIETGLILGDGLLKQRPLPPLARQGALGCITSIELDLEEEYPAAEGDATWQGEILWAVLRRLIILRYALEDEYRVDANAEVKRLLSPDLARHLRGIGRSPTPLELNIALHHAQNMLQEIKTAAEVMPENRSDRVLHQWQKRQRHAHKP